MELNELRDMVHENARAKGFYKLADEIEQLGVDNRTAIKHALFATQIALAHSELSEALELDRKNMRAFLKIYDEEVYVQGAKRERPDLYLVSQLARTPEEYAYEQHIKGSVEEELADVIIRILDISGWLGIDIQKHVELKMKYNELREYKHGKEY